MNLEGFEMLLGLISDTHDRLSRIVLAVKKLNEIGVEMVLHAGDYVSPFTISKFENLRTTMKGVFGNNDGDIEHLKKVSQKTKNIEIKNNFITFLIEKVHIALLHGTQTKLLKIIIDSKMFDLVVYGHTHKPEIYQIGKTHVVNPGEVCGYLTGKSTFGLFDTELLEAEIVEF